MQAASPFVNGAIGIPLLTGLIGVILVWIATLCAQRRTSVALVIVAVVLDIGCFGWSGYWRWETTTWSAFEAPEWAARLGASARAAQTRIDWLPGQFAIELAPNLNLLWRIPLTGGYTPLKPRRTDALLGITDYGANLAFPGENDAALDLAGIGVAAAPAQHDSVSAAQPFAKNDMRRFVGSPGDPHAPAQPLDYRRRSRLPASWSSRISGMRRPLPTTQRSPTWRLPMFRGAPNT